MTLQSFLERTKDLPDTEPMPTLFVGHGNPMNGIEDNVYSKGWADIAKTLPHPCAILSISAHWYTKGTYVHVSRTPKTIHDFWGFPEELYKCTYPAPGSPELAAATKELAEYADVQDDTDWGLDHGTWIVLMRMYPKHNIPVFQLSIDLTKPASFHYTLGKELEALRGKGVLVMGSGNVVHNLGLMNFDAEAQPFEWAVEFDDLLAQKVREGDHTPLIEYEGLGHAAALSIPTPDHYLPLLYILGMSQGDTPAFPVQGIAHASVSMRSVHMTRK